MSRKTIFLKNDWKFTRCATPDAFQPSCDDTGWETVRVPHDWAIAGPFDREHDIERKVRKGQADVEAGVREITGRTGGLPHHYVHAHTLLPDRPMYGSETASTVSSRGEYYFPAVDEIHLKRDTLQVNSYDLSYAGWATVPDVEFREQDECDFMMGEFVWTGFDYLGEPTPYSDEWPSRSSYFGIIDLGGIPKDRFYLYQSKWSEKDVLHLMPHWTWPGHEGQPVPVQCYTNHSAAELFVNGKSMGKRRRYPKGRVLQSNYRFLWPAVPYEPGELKVVAYDWQGNIMGETSVRTAGEPAAIELIADRSSMSADGEDMAFVTAQVVDKDGTLCPRANNNIVFTIQGPAAVDAVCNGDATSLESFKRDHITAFNGICIAYIRSMDGKSGRVKVTVSSEGLTAGRAAISAQFFAVFQHCNYAIPLRLQGRACMKNQAFPELRRGPKTH